MSVIQTGRFSDLLRRYLGMKGEPEVAGELAPEISAVFCLESDRLDWEFLKGSKLLSFHLGMAADVGNPATIRFVNPTGNTTLVELQTIWYQIANVDGELEIRQHQTLADLAGGPTTLLQRDTRLVGQGSAVRVTNANVVGVGDLLFAHSVPTIELQPPLVLPYILSPGNGLDFTSSSNNTGFKATIHFRERPIAALEL